MSRRTRLVHVDDVGRWARSSGYAVRGELGYEISGVADHVDLGDRESRHRAAVWLSRTSGLRYRDVRDQLDQAALDQRYRLRRRAA